MKKSKNQIKSIFYSNEFGRNERKKFLISIRIKNLYRNIRSWNKQCAHDLYFFFFFFFFFFGSVWNVRQREIIGTYTGQSHRRQTWEQKHTHTQTNKYRVYFNHAWEPKKRPKKRKNR